MIAIKIADLPQGFEKVANRVMPGQRVLISRPNNKNLVLLTEEELNALELRNETQRKQILDRGKQALKEIQQQSVINGTSEMTLDEINDIIKEVRQETAQKG